MRHPRADEAEARFSFLSLLRHSSFMSECFFVLCLFPVWEKVFSRTGAGSENVFTALFSFICECLTLAEASLEPLEQKCFLAQTGCVSCDRSRREGTDGGGEALAGRSAVIFQNRIQNRPACGSQLMSSNGATHHTMNGHGEQQDGAWPCSGFLPVKGSFPGSGSLFCSA